MARIPIISIDREVVEKQYKEVEEEAISLMVTRFYSLVEGVRNLAKDCDITDSDVSSAIIQDLETALALANALNDKYTKD